MQPFKEVDNYFTDSLLYQEDIESLKQSLPDNVDSGNETDSESEEDALVTISLEPIVAYLDDFYYNNPAENEGKWVLNEIFLLITLCFLRMYLSILSPYTCL